MQIEAAVVRDGTDVSGEASRFQKDSDRRPLWVL
jgi:hypothetical protein